ncbi:MAG: histidine phosphotransferase family protein [Roseomonas sp.]|nr:histidine phosphotransferase family protein [Roseomonas sp.]
MTDGIANPPDITAQAQLALAQAVCTRICHDLGGPTGALSGALGMMGEAGDDAAEVAVDAAHIIDRRLRFWRAAVGGPGGNLDRATLGQLAEGLTLGRRAVVDLSALPPGMPIESAVVHPLLLAMLVGVEAMPRGGTLRVALAPGGGFAVLPDGPGASWPPGLTDLLAGQQPVPVPRAVALPLLAATAAAARMRLSLPPAAQAGPGALTLTASR